MCCFYCNATHIQTVTLKEAVKCKWATNVPKLHWRLLWQQTWYLYNSDQMLVYACTYHTKPVEYTSSAMSNSAVLQLLSEHNAIGGAGRGCWLFTDPISYCLQQASLKSVTGDSSAWMGWPACGETNKTGQIASDATVSISQQWNQCLQMFTRWCNVWKLLLLTSQLRRSGDKRKWALACSNHVSSMLYCGASGKLSILDTILCIPSTSYGQAVYTAGVPNSSMVTAVS